MADLRLFDIVSPIVVTFDLLQRRDGLIDETEALATAVIVALGTDARANPDDILPDAQLTNDSNRRGWWADTNADVLWNGWPIGSRLWLLERHKITDNTARQGSTLARVDNYIREALRPFTDQGIASRIDVEVTRPALQTIVARVTLWRGPLPAIQLQYQALWNEIGQ
jgi:phage gp46-like protein